MDTSYESFVRYLRTKRLLRTASIDAATLSMMHREIEHVVPYVERGIRILAYMIDGSEEGGGVEFGATFEDDPMPYPLWIELDWNQAAMEELARHYPGLYGHKPVSVAIVTKPSTTRIHVHLIQEQTPSVNVGRVWYAHGIQVMRTKDLLDPELKPAVALQSIQFDLWQVVFSLIKNGAGQRFERVQGSEEYHDYIYEPVRFRPETIDLNQQVGSYNYVVGPMIGSGEKEEGPSVQRSMTFGEMFWLTSLNYLNSPPAMPLPGGGKMIELFKDGDHMAIRTSCKDEREFLEKLALMLEGMIHDGKFIYAHELGQEDPEDFADGPFLPPYHNDWGFQLQMWLPQIVDICCKYRGYKSEVYEERVFIAGPPNLEGEQPIATTVKKAQRLLPGEDSKGPSDEVKPKEKAKKKK